MKYWLVKSEPTSWSWDDQVKAGTTVWDGVRNHTAAANLKAMKPGDRVFFYHSNEGKEIVGIVEITKEAFPDESDATGKFVATEIKTLKPLKHPVSLATIKADTELSQMELLRLSRLSVSKVTKAEWDHILKLSV